MLPVGGGYLLPPTSSPYLLEEPTSEQTAPHHSLSIELE
jgi:hypothetical protein